KPEQPGQAPLIDLRDFCNPHSSLHRYLYAGADPIDRVDPTGNSFFSVAVGVVGLFLSLLSLMQSISIQLYLRGMDFARVWGPTIFALTRLACSVFFSTIINMVLQDAGVFPPTGYEGILALVSGGACHLGLLSLSFMQNAGLASYAPSSRARTILPQDQAVRGR